MKQDQRDLKICLHIEPCISIFYSGGGKTSVKTLQAYISHNKANEAINSINLGAKGKLLFSSFQKWSWMFFLTQKFLSDYGVQHRLSSVAFAQSNKRAELGVKSMKRLIRENTNGDGSLSNDRFLKALMTYRNTPFFRVASASFKQPL